MLGFKLNLLHGKGTFKKAKQHKPSSVVGVENDILVLGMCCFVSEEFEYTAKTQDSHIS